MSMAFSSELERFELLSLKCCIGLDWDELRALAMNFDCFWSILNTKFSYDFKCQSVWRGTCLFYISRVDHFTIIEKYILAATSQMKVYVSNKSCKGSRGTTNGLKKQSFQ